MKLAEALQTRADLNRNLDQLENRLMNNALVQEGEKPNEDPFELLKEFDSSIDELEHLMTSINLTNANTVVEGKCLTEWIAKRDALQKKIGTYKSVVYEASQNTRRATRTEIKVLPAVDVKSLQKNIDKMSKQLREIDNLIQSSNWNTDLI